ncbi:MAG: biotin--[acetyl-CoA-carboxylase] ligase [Dehalococcoidia bacterium]|nr:biotin--[acetyl-CoA-carboxylase] ligase [Dehalococcoidia bacterium]
MGTNVSPTSIFKGLSTRLIGRNILYYPSLPSTMDTAREMARDGMCEGTVILAAEQTAGKGRRGRKWVSPPEGSISLSIILHPSPSQLPQLNMVAGLATVNCIERATGLKPVIKWPNDVLLNGKKVSGILMENIFEGGELKAAIVGIGLNVSLDVSSFAEISAIATSLSTELGRELSPGEVLPLLLRELDQTYRDLQSGADIYERWLARVETLGKVVRVKSGDSVEEGYAESINADGSITLRHSDGSLVTMVTGE